MIDKAKILTLEINTPDMIPKNTSVGKCTKK